MSGNLYVATMFLAADIVVQAVMVGLLFASFVVWALLITKSLEVSAAKRDMRASLVVMREASTVSSIQQGLPSAAAAVLVQETQHEFAQSQQDCDKSSVKERIASSLERVAAAEARRIAKNMGLIATIGATAPFVGLFGTVWGIMNSFIGIAETRTTNLAVVAPGIAEALLATACGLVVAIPAVVIYNHFTRTIGEYRAMVADAAAAVHRLASRELDFNERALRVAAQ